MKIFTLFLLGVLAIIVYMLYQSFANAEAEISNVTGTITAAPGQILGAITGELSSLWNLITGQDTSEDADFAGGGGSIDPSASTGGSW